MGGRVELRSRFGEVPVCLVGHSMGAGPASAQPGADGVVAVAGLAPWLTAEDPVEQVAGRTVMLAHGVRDRITDPARSLAWAELADPVAGRLCRFEVGRAGHAMLHADRPLAAAGAPVQHWDRWGFPRLRDELDGGPGRFRRPGDENPPVTIVPRMMGLLTAAYGVSAIARPDIIRRHGELDDTDAVRLLIHHRRRP